MKILVFTDNHYSQTSSLIRGRGEKFSLRLHNQINSLNWLEQLAVEKGCSTIVGLGDFFDKPTLNAEELSALKEIKWNKNIKHICLVGNHEMGSQDLVFNSTNALHEIFEIIDKPMMECGFGYEIIYLPYVLENNRKPLNEILKDLTEQFYTGMFTTMEVKQRIILSHNDISGIRYGQYESKIGFDIKEITNACDLYINGHLHNQQQVSDKILNLGNLTGQNFSEDAYKYSHCVGILDTDTLSIELINNPFAFNFYKLQIDSLETWNNTVFGNNAVLSIKAPISIVDTIKNDLKNNKNVVEYRIISIPDKVKQNTNDIKTLLKSDHISQFKTYIINNLDASEALDDELSRIK